MATQTINTADPIADAEAALAAVEARIGSGDPTANADVLHRAESSLRFARWQRDAIEAHEQQQRERGRLDRIDAIRAELTARLNTDALDAARRVLADAMDGWVRACGEHDDARGAAFNELLELGPLPPDVAPGGAGFGSLVIGATTHRRAPVQRAIRDEATRAIQRRYPRTYINLNEPQD